MSQRAMFFIDFDGTIARQDVCCAMVSKFAPAGWEEINLIWESGSLSTEECARLTLQLMAAEPEELEAFFQDVEIDPTFLEFVDWAVRRAYPLAVLSDGYDNYIEKVWTRYGLSIPYYTNHLEYGPGWRIKCLHQNHACSKCGVCKLDLMRAQLPPDYLSIYIGDGYSDRCPSEHADVVFAKDKLARLCQEKGILFHPYADFADVSKTVLRLISEGNEPW